MTAESQPIEGAEQRPGLRHGALISRRRLAKAGLASPVVLGSLMSKPVLGADPLYHCTPSGQQSGNLSRTTIGSCKIGISPAAWAIDSAWPSPVTKGTDPASNGNSGCSFNGQTVRGTAFDGFSGLAATFGLSADGCTVVTSGYSTSATMLQVLKATATTAPFGLGRETIAAILNALRYGSGFPVTVSRVIEMFNAVRSGGTCLVNSVPWSASQVRTYFASLHG
jgi:hypothetical protein